MSKLHENIPVEAKVTEWLSKMGWTLQTVDDLKRHSRLQMNAVIEPILIEKVMMLNEIKMSDAELAVKMLLNNLSDPFPSAHFFLGSDIFSFSRNSFMLSILEKTIAYPSSP